MEYSDPESMAKELVKVHADSKKIYQMIVDTFGESPSVNRISGWRAYFKKGDPANKRKMPATFKEFAPGKTVAQIIRQYKCSDIAARRWFAEAGIERGVAPSHNMKPVPDDFHEVAPRKTKAELKRYYDIKYDKTLTRWLQITGITPRKFVPHHNRLSQMGRVHSTMNIYKINTTDMYDEAVDIIRRERFPVNRCNEDGSYNATGKFYRVGITVLTKEQLLERAERYRRRNNASV